MAKRMGFEGKLYWGTAGSTAATELTIVRDVNYKYESSFVDVSDRASIIGDNDVGQVGFTLEFEVNNDNSNAFIAALRAAVIAGTAIAFKTEDMTSGYGCDGDFVFGEDEDQPLTDAQRIKVSARPTQKSGRTISWS